MKNLILLALKNMARYKRRSLVTASAVAVGIGFFIFVDGWLLGAELESDRNIVWYETSSARIMNPGYWKEKERLPLSIVIENPEKVMEKLEAADIPHAPRTVFSAEIIVWQDPFPEDGSMPVRVFAIDPLKDDDVFRFRETLAKGRFIEPGEEGILLGSWLAEDLGAEPGYTAALVTRTRDGYFQTIDAEIAGIIDCPNPLINRSSVFIPLDTADFFLQMEGAVTEINLSFPEYADSEEEAEKINTVLSEHGFDLQVMGWQEMASAYRALTDAKQAGTGVILFLLFIIAVVGITNTMLMAVFERTRELGMLRALGMRDREIRFLFMAEAAFIGFTGSVIGIVIGIIGNLYFVNIGIDFSWMIREIDIGYRSAGRFFGAWNPGTMITAFFAGIIICSLVAYIPTRRALKMKITDCLKQA